MFRNQYDTDVVTWSPEGRIHQVEYAMEAVKQGSAAVGLRSKTHAAVATLKRSSSTLASYQKKIFEIDNHVGIAIAGLTADARVLCKFMRNEALNHKYVYEAPIQVGRLVSAVGEKSQAKTMSASKRPFGVGLLVVGVDELGCHLFQTCPSGNVYEYKAMSIGARSQSAKTYLERHLDEFEPASRDELIHHALRALRDTSQSGELTPQNCSVGIVGIGEDFTILEDERIAPYLVSLEEAAPAPAPAQGAQPAQPAQPAQQQADDSSMQD